MQAPPLSLTECALLTHSQPSPENLYTSPCSQPSPEHGMRCLKINDGLSGVMTHNYWL